MLNKWMPLCRWINKSTLVRREAVVVLSRQWEISTKAHASTGARESSSESICDPECTVFISLFIYKCVCVCFSRYNVLKRLSRRVAPLHLPPDECEDKSIAPTSGWALIHHPPASWRQTGRHTHADRDHPETTQTYLTTHSPWLF